MVEIKNQASESIEVIKEQRLARERKLSAWESYFNQRLGNIFGVSGGKWQSLYCRTWKHKELPLIVRVEVELPVESLDEVQIDRKVSVGNFDSWDLPSRGLESEYNIYEYTLRKDDGVLSNLAKMVEADIQDLRKKWGDDYIKDIEPPKGVMVACKCCKKDSCESIGSTTQFRNVDFNCVRCGYDIEKGTGYYYYEDVNQLYNERDDLNSNEPSERWSLNLPNRRPFALRLYCEVCSQAKGYDGDYRTTEQWREDWDNEYSRRSKLHQESYSEDENGNLQHTKRDLIQKEYAKWLEKQHKHSEKQIINK